jgi:hypothetical protein
MNPKPNDATPSQDAKVFHVIPWVRSVRDSMYAETRDMTPAQFADYVSNRASVARRERSAS